LRRDAVLLDSWAWIEYIKASKAGEEVRGFLDGEYLILTSTINIAEVYRHLLRHRNALFGKKFIGFMQKASFSIPVTEEIATLSAELKHEKKWGLGDSIIYATAKLNNVQLVSGDSDFKDEDSVIFLKR